jgi:tetratricopeptide (TPR) repeat protein
MTYSGTGEQLTLFQEEHTLLNGAIQDLQALRLDEAKKAFEDYKGIYLQGESVEVKLKLTLFLLDGFVKVNGTGCDEPVLLYRLWQDFEQYAESIGVHDGHLISSIKKSFFQKIVDAINFYELADMPFLADQIPTGFIYIQTGDYDKAIASLQTCLLLSSANAYIYSYLGDAYLLHSETAYARKLYLEAFLIDPLAVDWRHFKDNELMAMKGQIQEELAVDHATAAHWLPSHASVKGFFQPKETRQIDVLKAFVDEYLDLKKAFLHDQSEERKARLFIRAIVLCDNKAFLKMVKGIDFAEIRRQMKEINEPLFFDYMRHIGTRYHKR